MDDAGAAMLTSYLWFLAITVAFMQLLGQELKELVGVLLFSCDKILERLLFAYPETRKDVSGCVTISIFNGVEILKHIVHGTAQTMWCAAAATLVPIAEIVVSQYWVVKEALKYHILVAGGASIVDAP